jgi:uncharacterized protein YkwD
METGTKKNSLLLIAAGCVVSWSMVGVYLLHIYEAAMGENAQAESQIVLGETIVQPSPAVLSASGSSAEARAESGDVKSAALSSAADRKIKESTPNTASPAAAEKDTDCRRGSFDDQFLCLLNAHRKANGKGTLVYDEQLSAAALKHSQWMNATGTFSHTGESGLKFYERCVAAGTTCDAENIAYGFSSARELFEMWKDSPGHNANMLGDHTRTGLGVVGGYATSNFQ